ncbi:MAG: hypothetical protein BWY75_01481 [bacterium ADurb.Bin425]|nr:MAG: hypothetical protein BWY75_01481 [bacterium ADurb.Bin425]
MIGGKSSEVWVNHYFGQIEYVLGGAGHITYGFVGIVCGTYQDSPFVMYRKRCFLFGCQCRC